MAKQITSVDQSDRKVPINLRQSGPTPVELLITTRVRKSPYLAIRSRRIVRSSAASQHEDSHNCHERLCPQFTHRLHHLR